MVLKRCRQPANATADAAPHLPYRRLDRAYDGLPTVIYMNMLDANVLLSAVTQPSKNWRWAMLDNLICASF